jgi:hypothetical protein
MKIHSIIYLFLLKEFGLKDERKFVDSLVHIYRTIRFQTDWRLNKNFVSNHISVIDVEKDNILNSLLFFELITSDYSLTLEGEKYLLYAIDDNEFLSQVFTTFLSQSSNKIAYEDTCLSYISLTAANCGLCKSLTCDKKAKLSGVFSQHFRLPNYSKSFSKT